MCVQFVEQRQAARWITALCRRAHLHGEVMLHEGNGREFVQQPVDAGIAAGRQLFKPRMFFSGMRKVTADISNLLYQIGWRQHAQPGKMQFRARKIRKVVGNNCVGTCGDRKFKHMVITDDSILANKWDGVLLLSFPYFTTKPPSSPALLPEGEGRFLPSPAGRGIEGEGELENRGHCYDL
jgi:hypothetical protein